MKKNIVYVFTSCKRTGPIRIMYNLILNLDRNIFNPIIITLYKENEDSLLNDFLALGIEHFFVPIKKKDILFGNINSLKEKIQFLNPSVVHAMGVFPDYAVSRLNVNCQLITLHNYMYDDYPAEYGFFRALILEKIHMLAVRHAKKTVTCSSSLSDLYKTRRKLLFDFVRNGVDTVHFDRIADESEKVLLRKKLGIPIEKKVFVYSAPFNERKNHSFLIKAFLSNCIENCLVVFLGNGPLFPKLSEIYSNNKMFKFVGHVGNVQDYLKACDFYISSSFSEGLPTAVLEAMACGLPVVLSNIPQHKEIIDIGSGVGLLYDLHSKEDCACSVRNILSMDYSKLSAMAYRCGHEILDAQTMSKNYQRLYLEIGL